MTRIQRVLTESNALMIACAEREFYPVALPWRCAVTSGVLVRRILPPPLLAGASSNAAVLIATAAATETPRLIKACRAINATPD